MTAYESLDMGKITARDLCEHALKFYAALIPHIARLGALGKHAGSEKDMLELQAAASEVMAGILSLRATGQTPVLVTAESLEAEREMQVVQTLQHIGEMLGCEFVHTVEADGRILVEVIDDAEQSKQFSLAGRDHSAQAVNIH